MKVNKNFSLSIEAALRLKEMSKEQNKAMSQILEDFILSQKK